MPVRENISKSEQQVIVVTFTLGSQTYALPIAPVRQIIEMVTITPLPQINHTIAGVINFHGVIAPVINMRRLLGLEEIPLHLHSPIILVKISERLVGLIVDKVLDVLERPVDQIINPNNILLKEMGEAPLLQGLIQAQGGSILLLNPEQLFKPYRGNALSEAIDTLTQSIEQVASDDAKASQAAEIPMDGLKTEKVVQKEVDAKPDKSVKSRRKKTTAKVEITKGISQ